MFLARLMDPATRGNIRNEMVGTGSGVDNSFASTGPEGIVIASVVNPELKQYEGKRLSDIAASWNKQPIDMMLDLLVADRDEPLPCSFPRTSRMCNGARSVMTSICTDRRPAAVDGLEPGKPHPRARASEILGNYVREQRLLPIEDAIRR
jgi:N-acyl-D-amino-acid deacylase